MKSFVIRLHNFINQDSEIARLEKRHDICHEDDLLWRRGLSADGQMPEDVDFDMVSHAADKSGPGRGVRSDLSSDRRVHITRLMKIHGCKRSQGSKDAQEIRYRREVCNLTCK
jgi:hypothetical protein